MTMRSFASRARRALRKPARLVVRRLFEMARGEIDRFSQPRFGRQFRLRQLLRRTGSLSIQDLWLSLLATRGWPFGTEIPSDAYSTCCPGGRERILAAAERALAHQIDLLGSGPVDLGRSIDWDRDYKTGDRWPRGYFRGIDYLNRGRPSDVKTVWELSRLQWLLPCAQAYALTGDERYAVGAREVLEQWIAENPYACTVNWCVTMEPAMRIFTWCALMRLCGGSRAWSDSSFQSTFLCALYAHAVFTERYIERSDVNGNHFTADAAALVVAGAVFEGRGRDARRWFGSGVADLEREILVQVYPDGVDFEASTAYHRLVAELFLVAGMAAEACGRRMSPGYRERMAGMARFTASYMRADGTAPLWGDHDDARTLPMGPQPIRDHRYLVGLIALYLADTTLLDLAGGPRDEACWWFGVARASTLPEYGAAASSVSFADAGVYIIRHERDHVFIDCGPIGLAGRGGHGHNDMLSFEAMLSDVSLITEGGCYVYTADFDSRNFDRSTQSHNTPIVDGAEVNRFISPDELWQLVPDAAPNAVSFRTEGDRVRFVGSHTGYRRLRNPVTVTREITYECTNRSLQIVDSINGSGSHEVEIPLHFGPDIVLSGDAAEAIELRCGDRLFRLDWKGAGWRLRRSDARVAPTYGSCTRAPLVTWYVQGTLPLELRVCIWPVVGRDGVGSGRSE